MKLEVITLGKYFGQRWVFKDLKFGPIGGILGIAGPNGSGKSTLMRCLAGLLRQDQGEIIWHPENSEPTEFDVRQQGGFAAPYIHLYKDLTCRENLDFLSAPLNIPTRADEYEMLLDKVGIGEKIDANFKSLSSGQQQRMKLIAATIHRPIVLFLDEPGTNLDSEGFNFIKKVLDDRRDAGYLTILASNNSEELALCDKIINVDSSKND